MCVGHGAEADEGVVRRNRGRYHRVHEDAFLEEVAGDGKVLKLSRIKSGMIGVSVADFKPAEALEAWFVSFQRFSGFRVRSSMMSMALRPRQWMRGDEL